jgi:hypothetical protein
MAETDPMTLNERRKYIHKIWGRYRDSTKQEKSLLLDEAEQITGLHRKSILRILNGRLSRKPRTKNRGKTYGSTVAYAVRKIAKSLDYACAERLKPNLVWMAELLQSHGELCLDNGLKEKLTTISVSTIKRLVKNSEHRLEKIAFRKAPSRPNSKLKANIPIKIIPWDTRMPGHFEVDTVHHCGDKAHGIYAYTIQLVDVASGWSEIVPVYGNSFAAMKDGFDYLFARLPFPILEFHPDNGSEFINNLLLKYWRGLVPNVDITRSKPYRKNDNRFVEENNNSLIRAYIGPSRFDSAAQLEALRELEELLWLYHNCFLPCMRLSGKSVSAEGKLRRSFDSAQPPLDRLLASDLTDKPRLIKLDEFRKAVNPLLLREKIDQSIEKLLALPCLGQLEKVNFYKTRLNVKEPSVTLSFELMEAVR